MLGNEHGERKLSFTRWDFCISPLVSLDIKSSIKLNLNFFIMKTTNGVVSLIFSALFFLFSFNVAQAEVCVKPTPPVCYTSKTSVSEDYLGKDRQGSQWIEKTTTTNQVETSCSGSQKQIDYDVALTHYNVCLQVAEIEAKTLRNSNTQSQAVNQDTTVYTRVCPLPTQPEKQSSQNVVATNEFGNGTVIKQYGDGSYAIFNAMGEYEGIANSVMFDNAKNYQYAIKELAKSDNTSSRIVDLKDYAYLMNKNGESVQLSIDKRLSNKNNCPSPKLTCPLNSTLDESDGLCGCNEGYANDGEGKCETMTKWCLDNFGSDYYYDGTGNHIGACKIKNIQNNIATSSISVKDTKSKTVKISNVSKSLVKPTSTMSNFATSVPLEPINSLSAISSNENKVVGTKENNSWKRKITNFFSSLFGR